MFPPKSPSKNKLMVVQSGASALLPALNVAAGLSRSLLDILTVLSPVIGEGGVVALYQRSLDISGRVFPWLAPPEECYRGGMDLDGLKLLVARQIDAVAVAGAALLLKTFHDQLAALVGAEVARQLIGASPGAESVVDDREKIAARIRRLWGV